MRRAIYVFCLLALPSMLWLAYEAVVLRLLHGPQNLLFSLGHGYPHISVTMAFLLSAVSAIVLGAGSLLIGLLAAFGRLESWGRFRIFAGTTFIPIVLVPWLSVKMQKPMGAVSLVLLALLIVSGLCYVVLVSIKSRALGHQWQPSPSKNSQRN